MSNHTNSILSTESDNKFSTADTATGPVGIGGWLIIPAIGLVVGCILSVIGVVVVLVQVWSAGRFALHLSLYLFCEIGWLAFVIYAAVRFFKKTCDVPGTLIALMSTQIAVGFFVLMIAMSNGEKVFAIGSPAGLALWIISIVIWIPYFLNSKRVRNTFVIPVGRNSDGLIESATRGEPAEGRALIQEGADVNARMKEGSTARMLTKFDKRTVIITALLVLLADLSGYACMKVMQDAQLTEAVKMSDSDRVKSLLKAGADANTISASDGFTLLMLASQRSNSEILKALLAAGADANARQMIEGYHIFRVNDDNTWTEVGSETEVRHQPHVVVKEVGHKGYTALMMAVLHNREDLVHALLSAGADVNAKAENGDTAFSLAEDEHNREINVGAVGGSETATDNTHIIQYLNEARAKDPNATEVNWPKGL